MLRMNVTFLNNAEQLKAKTKQQSKRLMMKKSKEIASDIINSLQYRRQKSKPGEPPTLRKPDLRNIKVKWDEPKQTVLIYPQQIGGSKTPYQLEYGTQNQKARPYMRPAFARHKSRMFEGWQGSIRG